MKFNFYACERYRKLHHQSRDRDLTDEELAFLDDHSATCRVCAESMEQADDALDMLRSEALDAVPMDSFDDRLIRRHKVQTVRSSVNYWSPAVLGATVAALVVLAAMQMIAQSSRLPSFKVPASEARLSMPAIPDRDSLKFDHPWQ